MRLLGLLLGATALIGCTDTGAHLTLSAPDGPTSAHSFRVVLAAHDTVPMIENQRVMVGDNTSVQTAAYFLQRTEAGATEKIDTIDGFTVRIAPDGEIDESQFIPFVLVYDRAEQIVGIATYRAGGQMPAPILVKRDEIDKYTLTVESVIEVSDTDVPAPGQVQVIECTRDGHTFDSGIVWRPAGGGEYRIVLPDDGGMDATGRALDLDCDEHVVTAESSRADCDDTRSAYHRDAEDVCDGYDTNCDGLQTLAVACQSDLCAGGTTSGAVGLCDDTTGEMLGCHATASCSCSLQTGCNVCLMPYVAGSMEGYAQPCQPAVGVMRAPKCHETAPCRIEVLGVRNGWKVEVSATTTGSFSNRADGVTGVFAVKAKREAGYEVMGNNTTVLGDVDFAMVTATGTYYLGMMLRLHEDGPQASGCSAEPVLDCYP